MPLEQHPTDPDKLVMRAGDYRLPRPWVGLTDEELQEFSDAQLGSYDLCLEVEAKLKEKNNAML